MTTTLLKNLNDFVKQFLAENPTKPLKTWRSKDNQTELKAIVNEIKSYMKKKVCKDPNKPKRGKSAYIFFCAQERENVKKEHPKMNTKDITAELARRWNLIKSDSGKVKKYHDLAKKDKERYATEMKKYNKNKESKKEHKKEAKKEPKKEAKKEPKKEAKKKSKKEPKQAKSKKAKAKKDKKKPKKDKK